jgi:hypothetical protein
VELWDWVEWQRTRYRNGTLTEDRARKLGSLPGWSRGPWILDRVARARSIGESRYVRKPRAMFASAATEGSYDREEQLAAAKIGPTRRTR